MAPKTIFISVKFREIQKKSGGDQIDVCRGGWWGVLKAFNQKST
jgi:hypothetical protein